MVSCYRSTRLTSTVSTTEATTENNTINRQPSPPPSGRTSTFLGAYRTSDRRQQPQTIAPAASGMSWQSAWQSTSHHQTELWRSSWIRPLT